MQHVNDMFFTISTLFANFFDQKNKNTANKSKDKPNNIFESKQSDILSINQIQASICYNLNIF